MAEQEVVGLLRTVLQLDRSDLANGLKLAGADADAFTKKVQGAMKDAERSFTRPEQAVRRLEAAMKGEGLLRSANNIVEAMKRVGGATKLSDEMQARYNTTLRRAVEQYRLIGEAVPHELAEAEKATRRYTAATDAMVLGMSRAAKQSASSIGLLAGMGAAGRQAADAAAKAARPLDAMAAGMARAGHEARASSRLIAGMSMAGRDASQQIATVAQSATLAQRGMAALTGTVGQLTAGFGAVMIIDRAIRGVIGLGSEAFETAGRISDMANKTGLSAEYLQRLEHVANQTGGSLDNFTEAAFRLGVRLTSGSSGVNAAVRALGLELESLRKESPDKQLELITAALGRISNEQDRNRIGVELFGKSYSSVAAAIASDMQKLSREARVMTDEQIRALDEAGDAWGRLWNIIKSGTGSFIAGMLPPTGTAGQLRARAIDQMSFEERREFYRRVNAGEDMDAILRERDMRRIGSGDRSLTSPTLIPLNLAADVKLLDDRIRSLTKAERENIDAALILGEDALEQVKTQYNLTDQHIQRYTASTKAASKATKDGSKEAEAAARAMQQLRDSWTGAAALAEAERIFDAVGGLDGLMKLPIEKQKAYNALVRDVIDLLGDVPERLRAAYAATLPGLAMLPSGADNIANISSLSRSNPNPFGGPSAPALPFLQMGPSGVELTSGTHTSLTRLSELTHTITDDMRALMDIQPPTRQWSDGLDDMARAVDFLTRSVDRFEADGVSAFSNVAQAAATLMAAMTGRDAFGLAGLQMMGASGAPMSSRIAGGMNTFGAFMDMASAGNSFESAVQNAGDSRSARGMAGMRVGAQMGAQFGPYGALAGAGIGFAGGMMDDPGVQGRQRAQMFYREVDALFSSLATSAQEAEAAAKTLNARLSGGPVGQWQRGWILVRDAYAETGQTAEQALKDFEAIKEAAEQGPEAVARATAKVNEQLKRYEQLIDVRRQKQDLLNEAVERWGLSWEEAGKGFQMGGLAKQAETFITDWTLLIESGANPDTVAQRMAQSVNLFVSQARKAGIEVPEAMRPILETLIDQRLLIDDSGVAFKNLESTGLKFGAALERMFENVLLKLERLIDALTKPIPNFPARTPTGLGEYVGATAVQRRHSGGFIRSSGGGGSLFSGRMTPGEVPIIALPGESVLNRMTTMRLGGERGINALNAAADPMALVTAAASRVTVPIPSAVPYAAVTESNKSFSAGRADGPTSITIGDIHVTGAADPMRTAQEVRRAVLDGLHRNDGGFRTKLISKANQRR